MKKNSSREGSSEVYRLISKLSKNDIMRLARLTCKEHGHSYLAHPNCAYKDNILMPSESGKGFILKEKIGTVDIETFTFNFRADMGIMLTYCIKELNGKIIKGSITPAECKLAENNDKRLVQDMIKDLKGFTRVIGHFSGYFDLPFMRTRAVYYGMDFPIFKDIYHTDTWRILKSKFKLKSNSLRNACDFFGIPSKGHKFGFDAWYRAAKGTQKDIDFVLTHNIEDVESTEALWKKINIYVNETKSSI